MHLTRDAARALIPALVMMLCFCAAAVYFFATDESSLGAAFVALGVGSGCGGLGATAKRDDMKRTRSDRTRD